MVQPIYLTNQWQMRRSYWETCLKTLYSAAEMTYFTFKIGQIDIQATL